MLAGAKTHFDVHLWRITSVHFLSEDGKRPFSEGRDGWKTCLFPASVGVFDYDVTIYEALFPICTFYLAFKQLFPAKKKVYIRKMKVQTLNFRKLYPHLVVLTILTSYTINFVSAIKRL